jgi:hypothetical protein
MEEAIRRKLQEIQDMATTLHRSLVEEFGEDMFNEGGCLFLGRFYAESNRIYFGLNPGTRGLESGQPFKVELEQGDDFNPPFRNPEEGNRLFAYWRNWARFLSRHQDLSDWFNDRVTSTFLVPWRTRDGAQLDEMNEATEGKVFEYSGRLVRRMIEHHSAELLIVSGKRSLHLLNELMPGPAWDWREINASFEGPGAIYQWRRKTLRLDREITVLQIPHFSYARNLDSLSTFAGWLRNQVGPFGLRERLG